MASANPAIIGAALFSVLIDGGRRTGLDASHGEATLRQGEATAAASCKARKRTNRLMAGTGAACF